MDWLRLRDQYNRPRFRHLVAITEALISQWRAAKRRRTASLRGENGWLREAVIGGAFARSVRSQ